MAEPLLSVVRRGPRCDQWQLVTSSDGEQSAHVACNLKPGHPGPLHYDEADGIWWAVDSG